MTLARETFLEYSIVVIFLLTNATNLHLELRSVKTKKDWQRRSRSSKIQNVYQDETYFSSLESGGAWLPVKLHLERLPPGSLIPVLFVLWKYEPLERLPWGTFYLGIVALRHVDPLERLPQGIFALRNSCPLECFSLGILVLWNVCPNESNGYEPWTFYNKENKLNSALLWSQ